MLRLKVMATLMALVAIAVINWLVAVGIIVTFAGLDYLLQKEDEENLQDVIDYIEATQEVERQRQKDLKFLKIMEDGDQ